MGDMRDESGGQGSKALKGFLTLIDSFLSIFVIAPLVVGYWRGCWQLMDIFLLPDDKLLSVITSLVIGIIPGLLFCLLQDSFNRAFDHSRRPNLHLLASRVYTTVNCVTCVNHWRGVWSAWDYFTGISWQSGATSMGIGLLMLAITRGLKNILAPPFLVVPDHPDGYFTVPTLFKAEKDRCGYFLLDSVFTVVVTGSLVVYVWRGSWVVLDSLFFPDNVVYSAWGSMLVGLSVTMVTFLAQLVMVPCGRYVRKGVPKVLLEDIYHTICFVGDVNVWRGVWMLLNIYLLPDMPVMSNALTVIAPQLILMCFYTANSILVRGAVMDGAGQGPKGIIFPTHYLRFFYKKKRQEEQQRNDAWIIEGMRPPLVISSPLEATNLSSKANGICDGRGYGDGHSFSGGFGETVYSEDDARMIRQNTFLGPEPSPSRLPGSKVSPSHVQITEHIPTESEETHL